MGPLAGVTPLVRLLNPDMAADSQQEPEGLRRNGEL